METIDAKAMLRNLNIKPRRRLGQNFLIDRTFLTGMLSAAEIEPDNTILEVGPGLGVLTERLAKLTTRGHLVAVELDDVLAQNLRERFSTCSNVEVVNADILKLDPASLLGERSTGYKVVANLPYYITSPVLRHFLESKRRPSLIVAMVQAEVAKRIVARPPDMSLLAVSVQVYGRPRLVSVVPPRAFYPQPRVESAVLRIEVFDEPTVQLENVDEFFGVVRAGFGQRRKQLANALADGLMLPKDHVCAVLRSCCLDGRLRAQELTIEDWACISRTSQSEVAVAD
jgi:16S rRNA (adenine1518-N6/adenine1519-N6)-dimethyltransferase